MTTKQEKECNVCINCKGSSCQCSCHKVLVTEYASGKITANGIEVVAANQEDKSWKNELLTLIATNWQGMNGDELIEIDPVEWFDHVLTEERVEWKLNNSFDVAKVIKQGKQEALTQVREVVESMKNGDKSTRDSLLQDLLIEVEKLLNEI